MVMHDHYKETFAHIRDYWRLRNRIFILTLLVLALMLLQSSSPEEAWQVFQEVLRKKFGISVAIAPRLIGTLLWVVLLSLIIPYYQYAVLVDRQYGYVHRLEARLRELMDEETFDREGRAYLTDRPLFLRFVKYVYVGVFPALLLLAVGTRWASELAERAELKEVPTGYIPLHPRKGKDRPANPHGRYGSRLCRGTDALSREFSW
jgi:hypothetical protein